jgi:hypothetical protein
MLVGNDRFGARVQADSSRLMTSRTNVPDDGSDQRSGEFTSPSGGESPLDNGGVNPPLLH